MHFRNKIAGLFTVLFFSILFFFSCENSFQPLQENNQYAFTMYGTLDFHADTQWVRIMPIGKTLLPKDSIPDPTTVALIRKKTGETTFFSDSLFRFGGDTYVSNYWSTKPLVANENYTLIAENSNGDQSLSNIHIPSPLPLPTVEYSTEREVGFISGFSADPLVSLETRYLVQVTDERCLPEREIILSHLEDIVPSGDGSFVLKIDNLSKISKLLGVIPGDFIINHRELVLIAASTDWPDLTDLSEQEIVLPDVVSNVEHGTGLVAGISRRILEISPRRRPC